MNSYTSELAARHRNKLHVAAAGLLVGLLAGTVIVCFRLAIGQIQKLVRVYYALARHNWLWGLSLIPTVLVLTAICTWFVKRQPMISGSGIPQVAGSLGGRLKFSWLKVMMAKIGGGLLALGSGLTLGREGPSVQIGASCGAIIAKLLHRPISEQKYLISAGAASGMTAAFAAPLSGVVFALEEVHHNFSSLALVSAMAGSVVADFITKKILGSKPELAFAEIVPLPFNQYWIIVLLAVILAVSAHIFIRVIIGGKKLYARLPVPLAVKIALPFICTLAVILLDGQFFGAGQEFIALPIHGSQTLTELIILYAVKLFLLAIAFCSGLPGGIFFPLLVLGALTGNILGTVLHQVGVLDAKYILFVVMISMAGHFAGIVRAPVTGILLICEMSGSFEYFLPLVLVAVGVYLLMEWTGAEPIYETLLDMILHNKSEKAVIAAKNEYDDGILMEFAVQHGSAFDGAEIADLGCPNDILIVAIKRGGKELIPRGNSVVHGGDYLVVMLAKKKQVEIIDWLHSRCEI